MFVAVVVAALSLPATGPQCLVPPVPGPVIEAFAPVGDYGGHWGVDLHAPLSSTVRSPVDGVVSFSGAVAGRRAVTIDAGEGMKVTLSDLAANTAVAGEVVIVGSNVGSSGSHSGAEAVHLSVRIDGEYVDPATLLGCATDGALRLVPLPE